eukprot:2048083-Alexandrium_andersonii.AAC.1
MPPTMVLLQNLVPRQVLDSEGARGFVQARPHLPPHQVTPGSDPENDGVSAIDLNHSWPGRTLHHLFRREGGE